METMRHDGHFVRNPFGIPEQVPVQQIAEKPAVDSRHTVLANLMEEVKKSGGCNTELFLSTLDALMPQSGSSATIFEETYL